MINRPAFRFHGSKFSMAQWIIAHFPPHHCYIEPFAGSASVLLQKPRSWLEVLNDKDDEIVNFFRVLREHPGDLIRAIDLTPYAKSEWKRSFQPCDDPVEAARRFYVRSFMNIAGPTAQWNSGWRRQKVVTMEGEKRKMTSAALSFMNSGYLWHIAERLRGVQIECDDALAIIQRYDTPQTLFYLDPPYPASTRKRWKHRAYQHEMRDEDHWILADVLHGISGMAVISGYKCSLYDKLYDGWERAEITVRTNGPGRAVESVWMSPSVSRRQFPLFNFSEEG